MKKVLIFIMIVSCSYSFAQREHRQRGHQNDKKEFFESLSVEELATLKTKRMALDLNLSDKQQDQVYALSLNSINDKRTKRAQRENKEHEDVSSDEKYDKMLERINEQIAVKNEMRSILDDGQFEKWERQSKRKHVKKRRKRKR